MTTATPNKTPRTLIAAGTSNAAGATTRGTVDLRTAFGGLLTIKLTNGATGPTVQAVARVLVAHNAGFDMGVIRAACAASIKGHGLDGYLEALRFLAQNR